VAGVTALPCPVLPLPCPYATLLGFPQA
jgi:hypothetical protein